MDSFKTRGDEKALTLSFDQAATREEKVFHPWRYFVAGGETLAMINKVIAEFSSVGEDRTALAKTAGAKSYDGSSFEFDFKHEDMISLTGTERVDYHVQGTGSKPHQGKRIAGIPDFVVSDGRTYGQFHPDLATPRGKEINDACVALKEKSNPSIRFARWLECSNVDVYEDPIYNGSSKKASAQAQKIGNQWVVSVPVITKTDGGYPATNYSEEWKVPPDSTPLAVSEYFYLLEKSKLVVNTPKV